MNKNSKIYIAGHTGLVGSAIFRNLKKKGFTNIIFEDFSELDLRNQQAVLKFFQFNKPEYVILAAAKVGGIVANNTYRAEFIYENLQIQNNIIHSAYLNKVKKLLFLGSSCIYPKNAVQPMTEDELLTNILEYTNEPYAIAKIAGIKMCESYNIQYGTNFISVMPTNLYGINDNYDLEKSHVLPALIRKFHLGKLLSENKEAELRKDLNLLPIEGISGKNNWQEILNILKKYGINKPENNISVLLWGTGSPMREFLFVDDMAEACVHVIDKVNFEDLDDNQLEIRNTHINIGTGTDISIKDLANIVKSIIGFDGKIKWDRSKPDGTLRKLLNVNKINKLGWKAKVSLEEGIKKNYKWYLNRN